MWNTFVSTMGGWDPLGTIRSQDLREADVTKALVAEPMSAAISVSDLPSVPVSTSPSEQSEPVTTDFEVTGVLGEGGMGRVLLARQKSLQRDVALKVLKREENRRDVVQTLLAEAVITGSIEHPSIVPVHALGRDKNGLPVLVMKRIDGVSWRSLFEKPNHPAWAKMGVDTSDKLDTHLEILMSVCNAVHYAHSRGIVHRDIKLDNIMIGGFGEVYLVDWGIAMRVGETKAPVGNQSEYEAPVGTLAYMAPEMALGNVAEIDARTDVYLLGATLHFLLVEKPRHVGETILDLLMSARDSEPYAYDASIPAELAAICNRAMHVDKEKRFSSALELRQALASFRRHRGSMALSAKAWEKLAEIENGAEEDERRKQQIMTECRFAFMQAIETYRQNLRALEGLDHVLELMIGHEIARRNVDGARALSAELSHERPDLTQKIAVLETELAREKAEAFRLQAMERDSDLRIGARFQIIVLSVLPSCAILSWLILRFTSDSHEMILRQLILFPVFVALAMVTAAWLLRRRLTTAVSRRALGMLLLYPIALLVHRIFAIPQGQSIPTMLTTDMIISAILSTSFAIAIFSRVAWLSLVFLLGAYTIQRIPEQSTMVFIGFGTLGAIFLIVLWLRFTREQTSEKEA
jgi:serine/threonine-protein kinase